MEPSQYSSITNYIWGIADDVLRDLYVRGKYRDVILPMTVLRRLDAVLEDSHQAVLDMKAQLDEATQGAQAALAYWQRSDRQDLHSAHRGAVSARLPSPHDRLVATGAVLPSSAVAGAPVTSSYLVTWPWFSIFFENPFVSRVRRRTFILIVRFWRSI